MDRLGWQILAGELEKDQAVLADAAEKAQARLENTVPGHLESCGFELHRFYNVLEKAFERISTAFESHFEKKGNYHERLLERMTLMIPGIRPIYLTEADREELRELKSFRHLFRHAYDLKLRDSRLAELVRIAVAVSDKFPVWNRTFLEAVAHEQGWPQPPMKYQ